MMLEFWPGDVGTVFEEDDVGDRGHCFGCWKQENGAFVSTFLKETICGLRVWTFYIGIINAERELLRS